MANTIIQLTPAQFTPKEKLLVEFGSLSASAFVYDSGVCAIKLKNGMGEIVILPFQGQQIWSVQMGGRNLTMKSMFDEPHATQVYLETYGGFLIHCGATAMGVPTRDDTHPLHGELPNAPYRRAYLVTGSDQKGDYIGIGGSYQHTVAFNTNYLAEPMVRMYANASIFNVEMTVTNLKQSAMPLMYLAHVNFRPVDHGRLVYSALADSEHVRVRTSIPSHVHPLPGYAEFLQKLQKDPSIHHELTPGLLFDPEVVLYIQYLEDSQGWAHTMQVRPDGSGDYIAHRPNQLPKGVRWICRTADQDALGMVLPATAEPEGFLAEQSKGNIEQLAAGEKFHIDLEIGALTKGEVIEKESLIQKIISSTL